MSVKVIKRQYSNAFAQSSNNLPDWLIGNTGDWIDANLTVEVGIDFIASPEEMVQINKVERTIKLMNGKKWSMYGFDIGRTIKLNYTLIDSSLPGGQSSYSIDVEIQNLFNDVLEYAENEEIDDIPFEIIPTDRGDKKITSVKFYDSRESEGMRLKYTNIENGQIQSHSLNSFIDGTQTEGYFIGLNGLTQTYQDMTLIGEQSGMSISSMQIRRSENSGNVSNSASLGINAKNYRIGILPGRKRQAISIEMSLLSGSSPFRNQIESSFIQNGYNFGTVTNAYPENCLLFNADFSGMRTFRISSSFKINSYENGGENRILKFYLVKFKNGTEAVWDSSVLLFWYGENHLGNVVTYDNSVNIDVEEGWSYSLAWEYEVDNATNYNIRYLNLTVYGQSCEILNIVNDDSYKKYYDIKLRYMISSFFQNQNDLINMVFPNVLVNANSLTDNFKLDFMPEWNNPNIVISNDMSKTERLGNTGWFNENYNALPNEFQLKNIVYENLGGQPEQSLSYGKDVVVKATISGMTNFENARLTYGFIWLNKFEEEYKNNLNPFHKNLKVNSPEQSFFTLNQNYPYQYEGFSVNTGKMNVKNVSFRNVGPDVLFTATFSPDQNFTTEFENKENNRDYAIWVSVANNGSDINLSDRVSLLLDVNSMTFELPIVGSRDNVNNAFLEHPENNESLGVDLYKGFLEDDLLSRLDFNLKIGEKLNRITFGYEVQNDLTGLNFELERFTANTSIYPIDGNGAQLINFSGSRNYKLNSGNNKNIVNVNRLSENDFGEFKQYRSFFSQKIRWEEWLQKGNIQNLPVEFYNESLPFNGSNFNWLNYIRTQTPHTINLFVLFDIIDTTGEKRYKNTFPISIKGYDENESFSCEHNYFEGLTDDSLNQGLDPVTGKPLGVILQNKNTRIEITFTKNDGNLNLEDVYGVIGFEVDKGPGVMQYRQLSSVWSSESDNILIPLPGSNKLKLEQVSSNKIKMSCLVNYLRLPAAARYKITGRLGCFKNSDGVPVPSRIYDELQYELNYE